MWGAAFRRHPPMAHPPSPLHTTPNTRAAPRTSIRRQHGAREQRGREAARAAGRVADRPRDRRQLPAVPPECGRVPGEHGVAARHVARRRRLERRGERDERRRGVRQPRGVNLCDAWRARAVLRPTGARRAPGIACAASRHWGAQGAWCARADGAAHAARHEEGASGGPTAHGRRRASGRVAPRRAPRRTWVLQWASAVLRCLFMPHGGAAPCSARRPARARPRTNAVTQPTCMMHP